MLGALNPDYDQALQGIRQVSPDGVQVRATHSMSRREVRAIAIREIRESGLDIRGNPYRFTHVFLAFSASADYVVRQEGEVVARGTITENGQFVTEVEAFTQELIGAKIEQQLSARIIQRVYNDDSISYLDGVDVDTHNIRFDFTEIQGRGDSRNQP